MTKVMLAQCSILAWQSFIRASHSLSFELAGVILDKPLLAWWNPARTNQFLEPLNWHGIWYRPRITTCPFQITAWSERNAQCHSSDLTPASDPRRNKSVFHFFAIAWSERNAQCHGNDLTSASVQRQKRKSLNWTFGPNGTYFILKFLVIPRSFRCFDWLLII